ncbi:RICIN domain-containing protein [Kribbella sp. NBC_01245]|uniref:RICIN domain-containing protein n=1 Tax=Kribbella sp. NBC_01245 TaxID=2903578 RepID=UPI002E2AB2ED|nr:RICIN domain-containing protein [Kribbella sp. NBC_01245]
MRRSALLCATAAIAAGLTAPANATTATDSAAAAVAAQVWVTTPDAGKLLARQADVQFGNATSGTTIDVSASSVYQTMDGFGAAFTDSSTWLAWNKMNTSQRDAMMNKLFDRSTGIGLSLLRQPMGASDFTANSADYTYDDTCCDLNDFSIAYDKTYTIPVLKAAKSRNPGLKIIGTPWSPPAWMKTNNSLNGGRLRTDRYADFANYFVKYTQAYAAEGLPIYAVTLQNEPHHEASYPSMRMEPDEQAAVAKFNLGPAFAAAVVPAKIIAWDHNWNEPNYPISVLNDAAAKQYIAGSAFHCYAGEPGAQTTVHNAHPDRDIWFTECSGGNWATDFGANLKWNTQNLVIGATRNWAKGVTLWNMALDQNSGPTNGGCADCRGVVTIDSNNGNVSYNVEYYVLGHASKFVLPGAQRISSTTFAGDVESVAFRNPDGSIALIALNAGSASKTFTVRSNGQSFNYTLPAGAVATYTWTPEAVAPGPIDAAAWYQVVNANSGKCVDAADHGTSNGTAVQQWACGSAQADQQWQFRPTSDGYYKAVSRGGAVVWDVVGGSGALTAGTKVQLWTDAGGTNQQWKPVPAGDGYTFQARHSGQCLDVTDASTSDGARLQQWTCTGGTAQTFRLVPQP